MRKHDLPEVAVRLRLSSIPCLAVALIAACSSSTTGPQPTGSAGQTRSGAASSSPPSEVSETIACTDQLAAPFAASVKPGSVTFKTEVAPGYTRCDYQSGSASSGACTAASVSIDTAPQAFTDFDRWVVETTQNAGSGPAGHAPEQVNGIGLLADWVPATQLFETGTETRWIAVQLTCPAADAKALGLAEALARSALSAGPK
jgi:hypothetical protein